MADTTIVGVTLDGPKERDAIHIAVASVVAAERLYPGQHIGLADSDRETVVGSGPHIGIVDPFLPRYVDAGERFWMFLYPNTITSLKHVWTHPAFGTEGRKLASTEEQKAASEKWLRDFIASADCPSYETVIAAAIDEGDRQWSDEYLHFDGSDAHGEIPAEFWVHVEIVTGRKIEKRATYFSCSC
jgi:hypothetical protein